jgi:hypothetical protein
VLRIAVKETSYAIGRGENETVLQAMHVVMDGMAFQLQQDKL